MIQRVLSYVCLSLATALLLSVLVNDCGDEVADGKRERNTLVSRIAGVERYYQCEHTETVYHDGDGVLEERGYEWVWVCEDSPTLVLKDSGYDPILPETIAQSQWLRMVATVETWHEGVLGGLLAVIGFILFVRSLPPLPPKNPSGRIPAP
jgi:hypothetical protein